MEEMIALKRHFQRERWIEVDMAGMNISMK